MIVISIRLTHQHITFNVIKENIFIEYYIEVFCIFQNIKFNSIQKKNTKLYRR